MNTNNLLQIKLRYSIKAGLKFVISKISKP